ncbi:phosphinothricin N-acetyltransferase [Jannaschia pagri]|uniref:Phosphinothricin N-acetyltransferase n=1 Tax=Jannaschia pagri TaxID=2829797 RepID=A0ABQ4NNZ8_9RHOB|nr:MULTISPECIES: GNAT family N-acetyltransferase [unclassified Jannaschia]GIT92165.1 phosphinothricin N-acetyltransferase [Jannaschia sp. AI_61]GIT96000.1 phosphinothricin N-acetyltransferase [Jannaschia sp. AI_62]
MRLRAPRKTDGLEIREIHAEGLATGHASFRADPMGWEEFDAGFDLAIVAERDGMLAGFAGVAGTSKRAVYSGVGEVSTYVAARAAGRGIGRAMLDRLIADSEAAGWWTLVAQIFPENRASLALHRSCGFQVIGTRERLGRMEHGPLVGRWRDVIFLERRSPHVGDR